MNVPNKLIFCIPSTKYDGLDSLEVTLHPIKSFTAATRKKDMRNFSYRDKGQDIVIDNKNFIIDLKKFDTERQLYDITDLIPSHYDLLGYRIKIRIPEKNLLEIIAESGYVTSGILSGSYCISFTDYWIRLVREDALIEGVDFGRKIANIIENNKRTKKWTPGHIYIINPEVSILYLGKFSRKSLRSWEIRRRNSIGVGAYEYANSNSISFYSLSYSSWISEDNVRLAIVFNNKDYEFKEIQEQIKSLGIKSVVELIDIITNLPADSYLKQSVSFLKKSILGWDYGEFLSDSRPEITDDLKKYITDECDNYFAVNDFTIDSWCLRYSILGIDWIKEFGGNYHFSDTFLKNTITEKVQVSQKSSLGKGRAYLTTTFSSGAWPFYGIKTSAIGALGLSESEVMRIFNEVLDDQRIP